MCSRGQTLPAFGARRYSEPGRGDEVEEERCMGRTGMNAEIDTAAKKRNTGVKNKEMRVGRGGFTLMRKNQTFAKHIGLIF